MINIDKLLASKRVEVSFIDTKVDKEFVKAFRKEHHLTQVALANILGVTKKTIEKWEQGANRIGGSSAVLLTLLENNPSLMDQVYHVETGVIGKPDSDYEPVDTKKIEGVSNSSNFNLLKMPLVAVI